MSGYGWVDRHTDMEIDSQGTRECLGMDGLIDTQIQRLICSVPGMSRYGWVDRHTDTEIDSQGTRDVCLWMG